LANELPHETGGSWGRGRGGGLGLRGPSPDICAGASPRWTVRLFFLFSPIVSEAEVVAIVDEPSGGARTSRCRQGTGGFAQGGGTMWWQMSGFEPGERPVSTQTWGGAGAPWARICFNAQRARSTAFGTPPQAAGEARATRRWAGGPRETAAAPREGTETKRRLDQRPGRRSSTQRAIRRPPRRRPRDRPRG